METYIREIIKDLLLPIYQYGGISLIVAILFAVVWKGAEDTSWRQVSEKLKSILKERKWRLRFFFVLYSIFVLQKTIFNRTPWGNPLEDVLGKFYVVRNGNLNVETVENILLFLPFYPLFQCSYAGERVSFVKKLGNWGMLLLPFVCSLGIETTQLLFRAGTFQLSDLFFNTLGGVIGGLIYLAGYGLCSIRKGRARKNEENNQGLV